MTNMFRVCHILPTYFPSLYASEKNSNIYEIRKVLVILYVVNV